MKKVLLFSLLSLVLLGGMFLFVDFDKEIKYNCDNIDVVYLKPSEKSLAGEVARNIKGIAVIPEENYLVADTEILMQCESIDFSEYIDMGGILNNE